MPGCAGGGSASLAPQPAAPQLPRTVPAGQETAFNTAAVQPPASQQPGSSAVVQHAAASVANSESPASVLPGGLPNGASAPSQSAADGDRLMKAPAYSAAAPHAGPPLSGGLPNAAVVSHTLPVRPFLLNPPAVSEQCHSTDKCVVKASMFTPYL